jgi:hypothetical protein
MADPSSVSRVIVQYHQLYTSQKHIELVCGFYGPKHPKCKEAIQKNDELYFNFMLQFKKKSDTTINAK